jgi:hypothetical protein
VELLSSCSQLTDLDVTQCHQVTVFFLIYVRMYMYTVRLIFFFYMNL